MNQTCLLVALLVSSVCCTWSIVQKHDATIAIGTSFTSTDTGYIAGATGSMAPLFLYTTDGGKTLTNKAMNDSNIGAFLSIRMGTPSWGVAGGLGFIGLPCGATTTDGKSWFKMDLAALVCAFQGAATVNDGQTGVLIGSWADRRDWSGNGIQITTNAGKSWTQIDGDTGSTPARYGSFLSKDAGYVTSGIWPETPEFVSLVEDATVGFHLTRHLVLDTLEQKVRFVKRHTNLAVDPLAGYVGLISSVSNGGKDWKLVVNMTGQGVYFNEISCTDVDHCWATYEGVDSSGNDTTSIIYTNNGWSTYTTQLTVPGGALVCIDMLTPTFGWAAGALTQGDFQGDFQAVFYKTVDGVNWTLDSPGITNFFPMDISVTDVNHAYSAGITASGVSSFASYSS